MIIITKDTEKEKIMFESAFTIESELIKSPNIMEQIITEKVAKILAI